MIIIVQVDGRALGLLAIPRKCCRMTIPGPCLGVGMISTFYAGAGVLLQEVASLLTYYTNFDSSALRCPCIMASVSVLDLTCISWCVAAFKGGAFLLFFSIYLLDNYSSNLSRLLHLVRRQRLVESTFALWVGFGVFCGLCCLRWLSTYIDPM